MEDRIFTVQEACDFLKMTRRGFYDLIKRGEVEAFRIGRDYRITSAAIEDYIRRHIYKPGGEDPEEAGGEG